MTLCLFFLDIPPELIYEVSQGDGQSLNVRLTVRVSLFSHMDYLALYAGGGGIRIQACDGLGSDKLTRDEEGMLHIPLGRARRVTLSYTAELGALGKHGYRGYRTERSLVFDGGQVFLLPESYYTGDEAGLRHSVGRLRIDFSMPDGWRAVVPYDTLEKPGWAELNTLKNDAFFFGEFSEFAPEKETGPRVFLADGANMPSGPAGVWALYEYYSDLFGGTAPDYTVIVLPAAADGQPVIGGAGRRTVAASFDPDSLRDWQLLSHRMFHAFFDTVRNELAFSAPPNLWMVEGLATYYENLSLGCLPSDLAKMLQADAERQMAGLFARYLYMRAKEPHRYSFAPMDEGGVVSSGGRAEFLHYTAAPLVVRAFENKSLEQGNPPDALLGYCLACEPPEPGRPVMPEAARALLGAEAGAFTEDLLFSDGIPELWYLSGAMPGEEETARLLNEMERLMASWFVQEEPDYRVDIISANAWERAGEAVMAFASEEMTTALKRYSPTLFAFLSDYYKRAEDASLSFYDAGLRSKIASG